MVANLTAILSSPFASAGALLAICYRVPSRVIRHIFLRCLGKDPGSSLWLAFSTSLFSAAFDYNWRLVLVRPRWIGRCDGFPFPPDTEMSKDRGFKGFLYVNDGLKKQSDQPKLAGADAVWIHAHGGGFMAGEARQYHNTYRRWVERARKHFDMDLRILAVEYREYSVLL